MERNAVLRIELQDSARVPSTSPLLRTKNMETRLSAADDVLAGA